MCGSPKYNKNIFGTGFLEKKYKKIFSGKILRAEARMCASRCMIHYFSISKSPLFIDASTSINVSVELFYCFWILLCCLLMPVRQLIFLLNFFTASGYSRF